MAKPPMAEGDSLAANNAGLNTSDNSVVSSRTLMGLVLLQEGQVST